MSLCINDIAPDFTADTTQGRMSFHNWLAEILRVIDSLQLTARHRVATPANWTFGQDVIIAGSVTDEEAKGLYPFGWRAPRHDLRIVLQSGVANG